MARQTGSGIVIRVPRILAQQSVFRVRVAGLLLMLGAASFAWAQEAPSALERAHSAAEAGQWEAALSLYREATLETPEDPVPRLARAILLMNLDETQEALAELGEAIEACPPKGELHAFAGLALLNLGRAADALAELDQALALPDLSVSQRAQVRNLAGVAHLALLHWDEAQEAFRMALKDNPELADAQANLAVYYRHRRQPDKVYQAYERALALDPAHATSLEGRAEQHLILQKFDEARRDLLRIVGDDFHTTPSKPDLCWKLGLACWRLGDDNQGRLRAEQGLSLDPENPEAQVLLGFLESGISRQAPTPASEINRLIKEAQAAEREEDYGLAIALLTDADLRAPGDDRALHARGRVQAKAGNLARAKADLSKAILAFDRDRESFYQRGNVEVELGRYHEAVVDYRRALALSEHYCPAWQGLGNALLQLHQFAEAIIAYDNFLKCGGEPDAAFYNNRGVANWNLNLPEEAMNDFDLALQLDPMYLTALLNRGMLKAEQGDREGACRDLLLVAPHRPNDKNLARVLDALDCAPAAPPEIASPAPDTPPTSKATQQLPTPEPSVEATVEATPEIATPPPAPTLEPTVVASAVPATASPTASPSPSVSPSPSPSVSPSPSPSPSPSISPSPSPRVTTPPPPPTQPPAVPPTASPTASPTATLPPIPTPAPSPVPVEKVTPVPSPTPAVGPIRTPQPPPPPPAPVEAPPAEKTRLRLTTTPAGAFVAVNGKYLGVSPLTVEVERGVEHTITILGEKRLVQELTYLPPSDQKEAHIETALGPRATNQALKREARRLQKRIDTQPNNPLLLIQMGEVALAANSFELAARMAARALELAPEFAYAEKALGVYKANIAFGKQLAAKTDAERADAEKMMNQARRHLDKALAAAPKAPWALAAHATPLILSGDIQAARRDFEAALAQDPNYVPALNSLAGLDAREAFVHSDPARVDKLVQSAETRLKKVLTIEPDSVDALVRLALIEGGLRNNNPKALELAEKALRIDPEDPQPFIIRANSYLALQRVDEARDDLIRALVLHPNDPDTRQTLQMILEQK